MKRSISVQSTNSDPQEALKEVISQLDCQEQKPVLILFSSDNEPFWMYSQELKKAFPEATVMGTSVCVNLSDKGFSHTGLSALAVYSGIEVVSGIIFEVQRHPMTYLGHVMEAVNSLSSTENTVCVEFTTSFSNGEELVLDTFQEGFGGNHIPLIGTSSGELGESYSSGIVSLDGVLYQNTCVFVLIHNLEGKIHLFRENIFKPTAILLEATDVDCEDRIVYEYNNRPAAEVVSEALKTDVMEHPDILLSHPMGRILEKEIFITESGKVSKDGSISYFSRIYNHTKMAVLETDDLDKVWDETQKNVKDVISNPSFGICINCASRSRYFEKISRMNEFIKKITENTNQFIGFSGYGEQFNTMHLNQSMVLAVFE